ncbi:hypothetical protein NPIL_614771 [Nephila pilipes]|uniref:Uncharacterized protein n=1 Tax=Nephila pilipes TaxID=299642 RepID=A0A8X6PI24_NEPPI|nr:hypothetical protein NPIL_614771 [Nephila pilipes]
MMQHSVPTAASPHSTITTLNPTLHLIELTLNAKYRKIITSSLKSITEFIDRFNFQTVVCPIMAVQDQRFSKVKYCRHCCTRQQIFKIGDTSGGIASKDHSRVHIALRNLKATRIKCVSLLSC